MWIKDFNWAQEVPNVRYSVQQKNEFIQYGAESYHQGTIGHKGKEVPPKGLNFVFTSQHVANPNTNVVPESGRTHDNHIPLSSAAVNRSCSMLQEMQEIVPGLYLGPFTAATKPQFTTLLETGITHIVFVCYDKEASVIKPNFPDDFKYIIINIPESVPSNLIPVFIQVKNFIDACFKNGGKVLIHGNTGTGLSATLVTAYIMETKSISYIEALVIVQKKRHCVGPSEYFIQQLKEYEPIYKAVKSHLSGHSSRIAARINGKVMN
ncbi:hypothetical protein CDAR_291001 [Caerostris darwini]|uniref:Uncharacterized protein n=1 Tax=Caerostris darwini TaxID=1538125 RepID=A0AAV4M523_9ARAC|nr:hypothetical protein CDAR_291001 [Caerostris darwini]